MKRWEQFKNRYMGKIPEILSWIFNIAGLVLAILSFINNDTDLGWGVVLSIVIFNSIFLIAITIYETLLYKKGAKIEEKITIDKNSEISRLTNELARSNDLADKLRYYYKYIFSSLNKFTTRLCEVNSKYTQSKDKLQQLIDEYVADGNNDNLIEEFAKNLKETSEKDYRKSMFKEFNHFLANVTNKLKFILDISLREKGYSLETSISVKQFSRIVVDPQDVNDVSVITTFRDNQTYSQGKREIGSIQYSISKNTDFIYCLSHPYFLKNNIRRDDKTYDNEHNGFLEYYNCTIVVPITYEYPDYTHIYGYLTCDILNEDFSEDDILDDKMAEIMETTANVIGTYFDNMDFQWEYIFEDDFLDIVYNIKKVAID